VTSQLHAWGAQTRPARGVSGAGARTVHKLDLPARRQIPQQAEITAARGDDAEKLRDSSSWQPARRAGCGGVDQSGRRWRRKTQQSGLVANMLEAPATGGLKRQLPWSDQKFAEPVALSSTQPTDRPLPRRASRLSLDLIALRARRRQHPMRSEEVGQVISRADPTRSTTRH